MYIDWEGRVKTIFVADNMMIYVENLKDLLKKKTPKYSKPPGTNKQSYWGFSLEKTLMLGKIEDRRRWEQKRMRWLGGITDSVEMSLSKLGEVVKEGSLTGYRPWGCKESDMT